MFTFFAKLLDTFMGSESDSDLLSTLKQDATNSKLSNDWILVGENKKNIKCPIFTQLSTITSAINSQDIPLDPDDLPNLFRIPESINSQPVTPEPVRSTAGETCRKNTAVSILSFLMSQDKCLSGSISRAAKRQKSHENRSLKKMQSKNLERNRRISAEVFGRGKKIPCSRKHN